MQNRVESFITIRWNHSALTIAPLTTDLLRALTFLPIQHLIISIDNTIFPYSSRVIKVDQFRKDEPFILLRISYLWYTVTGMLIVLTLGTIVSIFTKAIGSIRSSAELSAVQLNSSTFRRKNSSTDEVSQYQTFFCKFVQHTVDFIYTKFAVIYFFRVQWQALYSESKTRFFRKILQPTSLKNRIKVDHFLTIRAVCIILKKKYRVLESSIDI